MSRNVFATRQRTEVYTCLANSIDRELNKAIEYLREQVRALVEHQEEAGRTYSAKQQPADEAGGQGKAAQSEGAGAIHRAVHARPDLRWYRKLSAEEYDGFQNRTPGQPVEVVPQIGRLTINAGWGRDRECLFL